jgi:serine/threonine protein kinase
MLLFLWANGQNLAQYWAKVGTPTLTSAFVKAVIEQCRGLVGALDLMHNLNLHNLQDGHYRHTDIKPINILRFIPDSIRDGIDVGTWKISDLGLAKRHTSSTEDRDGTNAQAATNRYRPPEGKFFSNGAGMTRRYDIWSMGCVMFELVIWLLHGNEALDDFNNIWLNEPGYGTTPYFEWDPKRRQVEVHPVVNDTIKSLLRDQECQGETAIGDLLRLIQKRMLVVGLVPSQTSTLKVPPSAAYKTSPGCRATAEELLKEFHRILGTDKGASYFFTGKKRDKLLALKDPRAKLPEDFNSSDGTHTNTVPLPIREAYRTENIPFSNRTQGQTHLVSSSVALRPPPETYRVFI